MWYYKRDKYEFILGVALMVFAFVHSSISEYILAIH